MFIKKSGEKSGSGHKVLWEEEVSVGNKTLSYASCETTKSREGLGPLHHCDILSAGLE